jgi:hypothetical protein
MKGASGVAVPSSAPPVRSNQITEEEIRQMMMRHGRMTIGELTKRLKDKLKYASEKEKAEFRATIKKICVVKKEGEIKFLTLKQ